ncbi:MAG TPA: hypothetical protein VG937_24315 [Polyangiaceae bacterium]|jgi:hypothetical protein|nr:hypothetical protein [Polyangiaceae bacterium]
MEWRIELQDDGKLIRITTNGPFQLGQQRQMFEELGAHPAFTPGLAVLFDNRRLDLTGSDVNVIQESVEIVQEFVRTQHIERLAGLVDDGLNFGVGRQFEILTDVAGGHGFRLFKEEELALRWLRGETL